MMSDHGLLLRLPLTRHSARRPPELLAPAEQAAA
jgi:hypothetical protein